MFYYLVSGHSDWELHLMSLFISISLSVVVIKIIMNSHGDNINEALAHFLIVEKKYLKILKMTNNHRPMSWFISRKVSSELNLVCNHSEEQHRRSSGEHYEKLWPLYLCLYEFMFLSAQQCVFCVCLCLNWLSTIIIIT